MEAAASWSINGVGLSQPGVWLWAAGGGHREGRRGSVVVFGWEGAGAAGPGGVSILRVVLVQVLMTGLAQRRQIGNVGEAVVFEVL